MTELRSIRQPGPPAASRIQAVPVAAAPVERTLPAGLRLLDALATLLDEADSACLTLSGGALFPFAYVIPAPSPDAAHAAFYSDTRRPSGASRLDLATVTLGWRDAEPFFHCHALWTGPDGRPGCGHVLPDDTIICEPIRAHGVAIRGARFTATQDVETGFRLFVPQPTDTGLPSNAVAIRLAPNQDFATALVATARSAGMARATLHGGVGSLIGARFTDAPTLDGFATEMLIRAGTVADTATLDAVLVDLHGTIRSGRLVAGDNPVLMTFEGVLAAV